MGERQGEIRRNVGITVTAILRSPAELPCEQIKVTSQEENGDERCSRKQTTGDVISEQTAETVVAADCHRRHHRLGRPPRCHLHLSRQHRHHRDAQSRPSCHTHLLIIITMVTDCSKKQMVRDVINKETTLAGVAWTHSEHRTTLQVENTNCTTKMIFLPLSAFSWKLDFTTFQSSS